MGSFRFLITPIVGGIIGFFTNWLAIKMLFVPRTEKRIFGIRVPFTPGVLPKSKERLANKVGETVGEYLLTEDTIKEVIQSADIEGNIEEISGKFINKIMEEDYTVDEIADKLLKERKEEIYAGIKEKTAQLIFSLAENEENHRKLKDIVSEKIILLLKEVEIQQYTENFAEMFEDYIRNKSTSYLKTGEFEDQIRVFVDKLFLKLQEEERSIGEILSEELLGNIKQILVQKGPELSAFLVKLLNENEALNDKLLEVTKTVIDQNVGQFIGGLVYKKVYDSIKTSLCQYIENEDNIESVISYISKYMDLIWENKIGFYIEKIENIEEIKTQIASKAYEFLNNGSIHNLSEGAYSQMKEAILNRTKGMNLYELISLVHSNMVEDVTKKLLDKIFDFYYLEGKILIINLIDKYFSNIVNLKINTFMNKYGLTMINNFKQYILSRKQQLLDKLAEIIAGKFNVNEIVEKKIIDYDVFELENMILNIASKELKYITYMGGALGLLLGFIPELLNKFLY